MARRSWWLNLTLVLALMLSMVPFGGPAAVAALPNQAEVEPELETQIQADGSTGYLIYFRDKADLSPAYEMDWEARGQFVMQTLQETAERSQRGVRAYLDAQGAEYQAFWIDNVIAVEKSNLDTFTSLRSAFPEVEVLRARRTMGLIEPEERNSTLLTVLTVEPNIAHVNADDAWAMGVTGEGSVVANIDTGVRYTHQALVNQYRGNLGGGSYNHNYNWYDPYGTYTYPADANGHGTHTMGTMVGDDGGVNQIGMAPGAEWMACRGCSTSSCTDTALLSCAQFVAAPWDLTGGNPDPAMRPNVVNNSWGDCGTAYDNWYQGVVDSWHAGGIYPVFSNGNASNCGYTAPPPCNTVGNPARYGNVTGVGSTGQTNGAYASHSNRGPTDNVDTLNPNGYPSIKPQVMAPGVNIRSSVPTSDTSYEGGWSGTSMSAPHVAGLIALVWQAAPCLVGNYVATENLIMQTATPITTGLPGTCAGEGPGQYPNQSTGWGEINAQAAVEAALQVCGDSLLVGTVTDAATSAPLEGVQIEASSATETRVTTTDANGLYAMNLFSDTYTVSTSFFGYQAAVFTGVELTTGMTTTLDVSLTMADWYTVEGVVTDSVTGWPLYASIAVDGYPGDPVWTDPVTGHYSISLPEGVAYTFHVTAWVAGYLPAAIPVGPLTGDVTQDIELDANASSCTAPGYALTVYLQNSFEGATGGTFPADGWAQVDVSGTAGDWTAPTSGTSPTVSPHTGARMARFNSYSASSDNSTRLYRTSGIDLSGASAVNGRFWMYHDTGYTSNADRIQVQISTDGGTTWADVGAPINRYDGSTGWKEHVVDISAYTGAGMTDVRLGLLAISAYGNNMYVDDVAIASVACTPPADGGLVVGNVYDDNTAAPLNGAQVANEGGFFAATLATPDDPAVDDAFYTIFSPSGSQVFTATFTNQYGADVQTVTVVDSDAVAQDFYIPAGWLEADPAMLHATVELGAVTSLTLDLNNDGNAPLAFELQEKEIGYSLSIQAGEDVLVVQYDTTAAAAMQAALTALGYTYLGVTDAVFRTIPVDTLLEYAAVFYAGAAPVDTLPFLVNYLDAGGSLYISDNDLGYYRGTTPFYQTYLQATYNVDNGGDFLAGEDIMAGLDLDISADPYPDDFTVGGEGVRIFKFTTSNYAGGVAVERADYKAIYTSFDFDDVASVDGEIALVERVLGFLAAADVPWLATTPVTGTIAALDTTPIVVDFYANVPEVSQPGDYLAELIVKNDTPYGKLTIPVTMSVTPPDNWGKLEGTVTGLGYCDVNPVPLQGAVVTIEGSTGMTWTLQTEANGFYELWLQETHSPLVVTASHAPDYQAQQVTGVVIVGQGVTVQDFDLRLDAPCLGVDPDHLSVTLAMGANATLPLMLTNVGAAALEFEFVEQDTGFLPTLATAGDQSVRHTGGSTERYRVDAPQAPQAQPRVTLADIVQDGGFEAGTPNPYWDEYSLNFGTPLCDELSCGTGGGTAGPRSGAWWAWFGGSLTGDTGYVEQEILINPGASATLNFWVWVGAEALGSGDYMRVTIDGTEVYAANVAVTTPGYVEVSLNVSAFADGTPHALRFASQTAGNGNISIDDVILDVTGGGGGGAVPWLFQDPISATLPADTGVLVADITFDAAYVTQPGTYMANLRVVSNDPVNGSYRIPVTMTVSPAANLGKLEGVVTSLGRCDADPTPLGGAEVLVESATNSWLLTTAADGSYLIWVDEAHSPLNVSVSHPAHLTAVATDVIVTAQMTTTLDFALRETIPCADATPTGLSVELVSGAQRTLPLTLHNLGAGELTFEISEISGTVTMVDLPIPSQTAVEVASTGVLADSGIAASPAVIGAPSGGPAPKDIGTAWETMAPLPSARVFAAVVADDEGYVYVIGGTSDAGATIPTDTNYRYNTASNAWDTMAAVPTTLDSADGAFIDGRIYIPGDGATAATYVYDVKTNAWSTIAANGGYTAREQYQVAIIDTDLYVLGGIVAAASASTTEVWVLDTVTGIWSAGVPMQKSRTSFSAAAIDGTIYVAGGVLFPGFTPDMTAEKFDGTTWSYIANVPDGGGAYTRWSYNADGHGEGGLWLAGGRRDAGWAVLNHAAYYDPETNTWTDSPTIPMLNQGRVYMEGDVAADGYFYVIGGRDSAGAIAYAINERLYVGYAGAPPVDVPWLVQDPITGTVAADDTQIVDVTFTALPTMTLGTYHATLVVKTNDPLAGENGKISVPVTMTIVPPSYNLTIAVAGNGAGDVAPGAGVYTFLEGEIVTVTATAHTGSVFAGWSGDIVTTTETLAIEMLSDTAITATFTLSEYVLTIVKVGDGTVDVDPDQATYHYGDVVTLTATADPGWTFAGWSGGVTGTDEVVALTIESDITVTATFSPLPDLSIAKTVSPAANVALGDVITYSVTLQNNGVGSALGILLTDTLPAGVTFVAFVDNDGGAEYDLGVITWSGDLATGEALAIVFTATVAHDDALYNSAITNQVAFTSENAGDGDAEATFLVKPLYRIHLPLVLRNYSAN